MGAFPQRESRLGSKTFVEAIERQKGRVMPSVEKHTNIPLFKRLAASSSSSTARRTCAWASPLSVACVSHLPVSPMATAGGAPPTPPALIERGESILTAAQVRVVSCAVVVCACVCVCAEKKIGKN